VDVCLAVLSAIAWQHNAAIWKPKLTRRYQHGLDFSQDEAYSSSGDKNIGYRTAYRQYNDGMVVSIHGSGRCGKWNR